jgi:hypothetical protein
MEWAAALGGALTIMGIFIYHDELLGRPLLTLCIVGCVYSTWYFTRQRYGRKIHGKWKTLDEE